MTLSIIVNEEVFVAFNTFHHLCLHSTKTLPRLGRKPELHGDGLFKKKQSAQQFADQSLIFNDFNDFVAKINDFVAKG
jgi:hypothetical protein